MRDPAPQTILLADYAPPPYLARDVELDFDIRADHTLVRAATRFERNPDAPAGDGTLFLHGDELGSPEIALDESRTRPERPRQIPAPERAERHQANTKLPHRGQNRFLNAALP